MKNLFGKTVDFLYSQKDGSHHDAADFKDSNFFKKKKILDNHVMLQTVAKRGDLNSGFSSYCADVSLRSSQLGIVPWE